ncbi:MAG: endo-1,4-beta-xylanase, partial [Bacteroidales bacterium]|nr:endo-1,4-beta-xylanase [Bacteroidales bacterium]
ELEKQTKTYQDIFESYIENVPEAQRHGITIWTLSDAADEHEFWLNGDAPNLFTADLERKWAYKGVCDGIAGEDLGAKLSGDSWKDKNYQDRSELEAEMEESEEKE